MWSSTHDLRRSGDDLRPPPGSSAVAPQRTPDGCFRPWKAAVDRIEHFVGLAGHLRVALSGHPELRVDGVFATRNATVYMNLALDCVVISLCRVPTFRCLQGLDFGRKGV